MEKAKKRRILTFLFWWFTGFSTAAAIIFVVLLTLAGSVYSTAPVQVDLAKLEKEPVDVIVCLTGGRGRIRFALELLDKGLGKKLFIAGIDPAVKMKNVLKHINWVGPLDERKIYIDQKSTSTIENAREVLKFLEAQKLNRILVVTSSYHARRSYYIFEKILNKRNYIVDMTWHEREPFEIGDWWKSWSGIEVTVSEYFKFFFTYLRLL